MGLTVGTYQFVGRSPAYKQGKAVCHASAKVRVVAVPKTSQAPPPNVFVTCPA